MGLRDGVDPWERIQELETENAELKAEIQSSHNILDGIGADSEQGLLEITQGPQCVRQTLDARLIRFVMGHVCPLGKIRR